MSILLNPQLYQSICCRPARAPNLINLYAAGRPGPRTLSIYMLLAGPEPRTLSIYMLLAGAGPRTLSIYMLLAGPEPRTLSIYMLLAGAGPRTLSIYIPVVFPKLAGTPCRLPLTALSSAALVTCSHTHCPMDHDCSCCIEAAAEVATRASAVYPHPWECHPSQPPA